MALAPLPFSLLLMSGWGLPFAAAPSALPNLLLLWGGAGPEALAPLPFSLLLMVGLGLPFAAAPSAPTLLLLDEGDLALSFANSIPFPFTNSTHVRF